MTAIKRIKKEILSLPKEGELYVIESRIKIGGKKESFTYRKFTHYESFAYGKVRIDNGYIYKMLELVTR